MYFKLEEARTDVRRLTDELLDCPSRPELRIGLVTYRDHEDEYLVRTHPLTRDLGSVYRFMDAVVAAGVGDPEEAVGAGLDAALRTMEWNAHPLAHRAILLYGDAAARFDDHEDPHLDAVAALARSLDVQIHTVPLGGDCVLEGQWAYLAQATGGTFARPPRSPCLASGALPTPPLHPGCKAMDVKFPPPRPR